MFFGLNLQKVKNSDTGKIANNLDIDFLECAPKHP